jgi:hypothetical protein
VRRQANALIAGSATVDLSTVGEEHTVRITAALAFVIAASPAQTASLTLGCVGNVTTSVVPNDGVAPVPKKDVVSEYSIAVDLDQRVVFAFWFDNSGISLSPLPIIKADANHVYFDASREDRVVEKHITGQVGVVTGAVYADDFIIFLNGEMQHRYWALDCKPAHPQYLGLPSSGLLNER